MSGGRESKYLVDRFSDDTFTVSIYSRPDRPGFRVVSRYVGDRQVERAAATLEAARKNADVQWRAHQRGDTEAPSRAPLTLGEFVERIEAETLKGSQGAVRCWRLFERHVGADRALRRVWRLDVVDFLDAVEDGRYRHKGRASAAEKPTSSSTLASYLRTLGADFRWAIRERWMSDDPTEDVNVEHEHTMGTWLPWSCWEPYLTACSPAHAIRSGFALETGLREGEIAAARPEWVHGEVGRPVIYVGPDGDFMPKWGTARAVPLTAEAQVWLARARAMWPGSRFLFSGDGLSALGNLARETRRAVELSGVPKVTFHGLRRSAGAHFLDLGMPLLEVSRILGHRTILTTERWYAGMSDSTLIGAIARHDARRAELIGADAMPVLPLIRTGR